MLGSARSVMMKSTTPPGPVLPAAYATYNFNENTGTTAADSSGNGRNLTVVSATWATGHTGSALSNTAATTGATSTMPVPSAAITLAAWVKPLQLPPNEANFAFGFFNGSSTRVAFFTQRNDFGDPNVLQFNLHNGGLAAVMGTALTVGVWTHIAATYSGTAVKVYQDGVVTGTGTVNGALSSSSDFYVAGGNGLNTQVVVDDLRVFDVALTDAEVIIAMNTPVS